MYDIIPRNSLPSFDNRDKGIEDLIEDFLNLYRNINTQRNYHSILQRYFLQMQIVSLSDFISVLGQNFALLCQETSQYLSLGSVNTIKLKCSCLNSFYKWFLKVYQVDNTRNPVIKPRLPNLRRKAKTKSLPEKDFLEKMEELRTQAGNNYLSHLTYSLALLMGTTSIRISEALQITTEMIEEGTLYFIQKRGEEREMDLPGSIQEALFQFQKKYKIQGYLFQTEGERKGISRKPLSRHHAYKLLKENTGIGCHGFRKSAIEMLINAKVHPSEIVKVTGHASLEMVNYYDGRDKKATEHHILAGKLEKN